MIREKNRRDAYKKMKSKEIFKMSKSKTKASVPRSWNLGKKERVEDRRRDTKEG